jgi:hypothetical protein
LTTEPHVELLLSCAATVPGRRVRTPAGVDWPRFDALVEHHGMGPHVHAVLSASDVPDDALPLRPLDARASAHSLLLTARLLQVLGQFEAAGIPVVTLKGPALAQRIYGEPGMRDSVDLDLLVPAVHAETAARLLEARGYQLESELGWLGMGDLIGRCTELTFRNHTGTAVDLHWASAPADHPCRIPDERLWASVTSVSIAGRRVPVLSDECLLLYLCIHGTRHCWTKLRWLCDVAMLISSPGAIEWDHVDALAAEARASHALSLGLLLAHGLLAAGLPPQVLHRVRADDAAGRRVGEVMDCLRAPAPPPPPTSAGRTLFNARLAASGWLQARHVAALMKAPTEADAALVKLPRPLLFLYYPFRAARLAAKYGRSLVAG